MTRIWLGIASAVLVYGCEVDRRLGGESSDAGASSGGFTTAGGSTGGNSVSKGTKPAGGTTSTAATTTAGGTAATSVAGAPRGGSSAGGATGCIDVCNLYGPACCVWSTDCIELGSTCVLEVLSARVSVIYEYASLEREIAAISQATLVSITDADVAWAAIDPQFAARLELHLTQEASARYSSVLDEVGDGHPFRISCNGQSLFVGVSYIWIGQAAINTPVFDTGRDTENLLTLYLGAWEGAWVGFDVQRETERKRFDRNELRAAFCQRGALKVLDPNARPTNSGY